MKIIVDIANGHRFDAGIAKVIGKWPKNTPYVNIDDKDGNLVASINEAQMNKLVKAWQRAVGK